MKQLSRHWEAEFERLCTLLAYSAVVHSDETSWSINSVWAFLSEKVRLLFFGVHKDAQTLQTILDPAIFDGYLHRWIYAVTCGWPSCRRVKEQPMITGGCVTSW